MTVGIQLGSITDEIGTSGFFHAFFSTIAGNLEPEGWGSRFPILMRNLYSGELSQNDAKQALAELKTVRQELSSLPVDNVIWDFEDRVATPPWGKNIAATITDLSNYFITSTGRDLISTLLEIVEELDVRGGIARVIQY